MQHLRTLFQSAENIAAQNPEQARRYVAIAWRIVQRTRVRLPWTLRHRFCHRCGAYFRPGVNSRIRTRRFGRVSGMVITCLECGYHRKVIWTRGISSNKAKRREHLVQN